MTSTVTLILAVIVLAGLLRITSPFYLPSLGKTLVKIDMSRQLSKSKLQEKSVSLDNGRTAWYLERDDKQNTNEKPLVIVPGLGVYMRLLGVQFGDLIKLIPNRRVIIFELPYHGKRVAIDQDFVEPGCSIDALTACLERFLLKLGLTESFDLMGYSLGGSIATNYAIRNPNNINQLILLAPYFYNEVTSETYNATYESKNWGSLAAWDGQEELEHWFHDWLGMEKADRFPGFIMSGLAALRSELYPENYWTKFYDQVYLESSSTKLFLKNNKAKLGLLSSPVLVVAGTTDKICDYNKQNDLENIFNSDSCMIKNFETGHWFAPKGQTLFEVAAEDVAKFLHS